MLRKLRRYRKELILLWVALLLLALVMIFYRDAGIKILVGSRHQLWTSHDTDPKVSVEAKAVDIPPTHGYELARRVAERCSSYVRNRISGGIDEGVFGSFSSENIDLCIVWKVGTTFIRRLFLMKQNPRFAKVISPYEINFSEDYVTGSRIRMDLSVKRFLFVRNPYKRLLSAFVDKLMAPNPVYWTILGVKIAQYAKQSPSPLSLACGHDVEFHEFIRYSVLTLDPTQRFRPGAPDGHISSQSSLCKPCHVKYDFIGKMENFQSDSIELIRQMRFTNETLDVLSENGDMLSAEDAILDSCYQPFDPDFQAGLLKCISFYEALKRTWRKMQIRGLIGPEDIPVTEKDAVLVTQDKLFKLAMESRDHTTQTERLRMKNNFYREFYNSIGAEDLSKLRAIYAEDFMLFEYDHRPF
ncbi:hypothetical protein DPMN_024856 [Dreissena polymorpha]|uniref:Carbohydrate sulfotransferase n=2 Tax=Dreissena polymorpha TaxID=45954 RepID=A0A9D4RCR5_DREPO|nr:hypothetical protein DPMN_024856 [Dreissena polymorpha]